MVFLKTLVTLLTTVNFKVKICSFFRVNRNKNFSKAIFPSGLQLHVPIPKATSLYPPSIMNSNGDSVCIFPLGISAAYYCLQVPPLTLHESRCSFVMVTVSITWLEPCRLPLL